MTPNPGIFEYRMAAAIEKVHSNAIGCILYYKNTTPPKRRKRHILRIALLPLLPSL